MTEKSFKGNKSALPSKICMQCGRLMTWRKAWANNWQAVKYCSKKCKSTHTVEKRHA